jgi:hypothetical protein
MEPRTPPERSAASTTSRGWRWYFKSAVGVLAALGILGAVGSRVVDEIWPDLEETVSGGGPLDISVREDPQGGSDGFSVATRSPAGLAGRLRQARDCDSLFNAAKDAGAVDINRSLHALLLEGSTHRDVAIVDMRARIRKRARPLGGANIRCASAGELGAIGVFFNLDESRPTARALRPGLRPGKPYFAGGNVVSVTKKELQPFRIVAEVSRDYVEWDIQADLIIDGEAETLTIDNNGEPFRLTGERGHGDYTRYYEWVWYEEPQRLYVSDEPRSPV